MLTMFDFSSVYQAYIACRRGKRTSHNTQGYEVRFLPVSARRKMKKSQVLPVDLDMYVAPLTILKGIRSYLRWAELAHLFVAEEGYEKKGIKHRVLRLLWQPAPLLSPSLL